VLAAGSSQQPARTSLQSIRYISGGTGRKKRDSRNSLNKLHMNIMKSTIIVVVILLFCSCNRKSATETNLPQIKEVRVENFDTFMKKFYSDSIFQINRIVFPLENDRKIEIEYAEALKDSNNISITKNNNYTRYNKSNWMMLTTNQSFGNDSIVIVDGIKYIRRFHKTEKYVEESILYADPEYIFMTVKYKLINGKWYLVDYQNELDNEQS
jgi:hypothetical protein